ncbi:MAG TPA: DUF1127 domain-containing protein [Acetobacteraceae bacterium]|nr:DUF1127 domain-containing protein [Acetobacteraceae bacterium]
MATLYEFVGARPVGRPQGFIAQLGAVVRQHRADVRERRRIERELSTYTDRELGDLGISREDIPAIARGTFRR